MRHKGRKGVIWLERCNRTIVYLRLEDRIQSKNEHICVKDVASIVCEDKKKKKVIEELEIFRFIQDMEKRQIIGILWIVQKIQESFPDADVHVMGANDVVVEYLDRKSRKSFKQSKWFTNCKIALVSLVSFFGGAFTIMAFHNDIAISELFGQVYYLATGKQTTGYTMLEIFYSIGLALGIILFFNHVGGRRITKDPTPIEVAMRLYEKDVNTAMSETWNREGKSVDVS